MQRVKENVALTSTNTVGATNAAYKVVIGLMNTWLRCTIDFNINIIGYQAIALFRPGVFYFTR